MTENERIGACHGGRLTSMPLALLFFARQSETVAKLELNV